jgi:hypothetical protein
MRVLSEDLRTALTVLNVVPANAISPPSLFCHVTCTPHKYEATGDPENPEATAYLTLTVASTARGEMSAAGWLAKGEANWEYYVDRKVLEVFVASAGATVDFLMTKDALLIKSGSRKAVLASPGVIEGYGEAQGPAEPIVKPDAVFLRGLTCAAQFAPAGAATSQLNCAYLAKDWGIFATDSFCVFFHKHAIDKSYPCPLLIPAALALNAVHLHFSNEGAAAHFEGGEVYQPVSLEARKDYPIDTLKNVISDALEGASTCSFAVHAFQASLAYLSKFAFSDPDAAMVSCEPTKEPKKVRLSIQTGQGLVHDTIDIKEGIPPQPAQWLLGKLLIWVDYVRGEEYEEVLYHPTPAGEVFAVDKDERSSVYVQSAISK